jgi:hypothetical protein
LGLTTSPESAKIELPIRLSKPFWKELRMSLMNCRACNRQVSIEAKACPHCGAPYPTDANWSGTGFEWRTRRTVLGFPLVHVAFGRDARGRLRVAKGVVAVGQFAVGLITFAQFGVGLLFGFGQFIVGCFALAQFAGALLFGVGQVAVGFIAVGQLVVAYYGLGQLGVAQCLWSPGRKDAEAAWFFVSLYNLAREMLHLQ